jgi:hypothetical protein
MARPEITGRKASTGQTIFDATGELMPDSLVAKNFNVCSKTVDRWDHDPKLEFPGAVWINGRKYRRVDQLKQFVLKRIKAGCRTRWRAHNPGCDLVGHPATAAAHPVQRNRNEYARGQSAFTVTLCGEARNHRRLRRVATSETSR